MRLNFECFELWESNFELLSLLFSATRDIMSSIIGTTHLMHVLAVLDLLEIFRELHTQRILPTLLWQIYEHVSISTLTRSSQGGWWPFSSFCFVQLLVGARENVLMQTTLCTILWLLQPAKSSKPWMTSEMYVMVLLSTFRQSIRGSWNKMATYYEFDSPCLTQRSLCHTATKPGHCSQEASLTPVIGVQVPPGIETQLFFWRW